MMYKIVNPSDPYTLEANNLETAAVVCVFLGEGRYELQECETSENDGAVAVPFFMFGGADKWFKDHFGRSLDESINHVGYPAIAAVLDTVLIGSPGKRDYERSSMNDIGGKAKRLAAGLRSAKQKQG